MRDMEKDFVDGMVKGSKWQQERSYSEEEVGELAKYHKIIIDGVKLNELFKDFKK